MYEVSKSINFCYGHRLLDYEGPCQHLHGHNARVEIRLARENLDHRGMVEDFGDIKDTLKQWIDKTLDHTLLLRKDDPLIDVLNDAKEHFLVVDENPTAEHIAKLIYAKAMEFEMPVVAVTVWETDSSFARYSE